MISKNDKISNGMKMVSVIPLAKGVPKEELTYFTAQEINPLSIVSVSLRNKKILGLAISVENAVNMGLQLTGGLLIVVITLEDHWALDQQKGNLGIGD